MPLSPEQTRKLQTGYLYERVAAAIAAELADKPRGYQLESQLKLAARHGVGIVTMRRAKHRLIKLKVIELAGTRYQVT